MFKKKFLYRSVTEGAHVSDLPQGAWVQKFRTEIDGFVVEFEHRYDGWGWHFTVAIATGSVGFSSDNRHKSLYAARAEAEQSVAEAKKLDGAPW